MSLDARLDTLSKKIFDITDKDSQDDDDGDGNGDGESLVTSLQSLCALVREAEAANVPDFDMIVNRVEELINSVVDHAYGESELYDFFPSFAHTDEFPLLKDSTGAGASLRYLLNMLIPVIQQYAETPVGRSDIEARLPKPPLPWSKTKPPHPTLTTLLSHFRDNTGSSANASTPTANFIFEARCEVSSDDINCPIQIALGSPAGTCLAIPSLGGYKNRTPVLQYYLINEEIDVFADVHNVDVGLSDIAYHSTTDEARKLIFVGDGYRVKSYAWGSATATYENALATHTLDSGRFAGPMAVLPDGRFIRAGKGSIGVWKIDNLETHGPKGKKRIGKRFNAEDSWRDDGEDIELSRGTAAGAVINLQDAEYMLARWIPHPSAGPGVMLCGTDPHTKTAEGSSYSCLALDLENGGAVTGKYIGHGGEITGFSTSVTGDANAFLTACSDGYARLYDVRHRLPVMSFDSGHEDGSACPSAVIAHPDGVPVIFTGSEKGEQIRVWDVRARKVVYDLATGNNEVTDLAWDAERSTLYAATNCSYIDRIGMHHDYRRAKIPKKVEGDGDIKMTDDEDEDYENVDDEDEDEDEDDDDDDDEYRCWPQRAFHNEDYYGFSFDAGDHRIYRYAFKSNPNMDLRPPYGSATLDSDSYW